MRLNEEAHHLTVAQQGLCGLYYNPIKIVNDDARAVNKLETDSLTPLDSSFTSVKCFYNTGHWLGKLLFGSQMSSLGRSNKFTCLLFVNYKCKKIYGEGFGTL